MLDADANPAYPSLHDGEVHCRVPVTAEDFATIEIEVLTTAASGWSGMQSLGILKPFETHYKKCTGARENLVPVRHSPRDRIIGELGILRHP